MTVNAKEGLNTVFLLRLGEKPDVLREKAQSFCSFPNLPQHFHPSLYLRSSLFSMFDHHHSLLNYFSPFWINVFPSLSYIPSVDLYAFSLQKRSVDAVWDFSCQDRIFFSYRNFFLMNKDFNWKNQSEGGMLTNDVFLQSLKWPNNSHFT